MGRVLEIAYLTIEGEWKTHRVATDAKTINLTGKGIVHLDFIQFQNYTNLESLSLTANHLSRIDFKQLKETQLVELFLGGNNLENIDLAGIEVCSKLEYLSIANSKISEIDLSPLSDCKTLRRLDLSLNKLTQLDLAPLSTCRIENLKVSDNLLEHIALQPLGECKRLVRIDMAHNRLKSVDFAPLARSESLRVLWLYMNHLETIELNPLGWVSTLSELKLENNRLMKINLQPLRKNSRLKILYLDTNQFQEIDLTPLFKCKLLKNLSIDGGVTLVASKTLQETTNTPKGLQKHIEGIHWTEYTAIDESEPPSISYINPAGFEGPLLRLVTEINQTMDRGCYLATIFLCRKLLESLLISVMSRKFGSTNEEYYMSADGFKKFHIILKKFWNVFAADIKPFSPIQDQTRVRSMKKLLQRLKKEFNIDVHELGLFPTQESLLKAQSNVVEAVSFLKHITDHIS